MQALSLLNHWLNGLAPALGVACLLTWASGLFWRRQMAGSGWLRAVVTLLAGALTLLAGLWWGGQEGQMRTYAALIVVCATVQWLFLRPWQGFRGRQGRSGPRGR